MVYSDVESFLNRFCPSSLPVLLALSGGADSLSLFYCLLKYQKKHRLSFHVAHLDHGWRQESGSEAIELSRLASRYQIPFYTKKISDASSKENLEAYCRKERYAFFAEICGQISFQGVLTGHHQDDQAETVCKRILEGSHWSRWRGLQRESYQQELRILRPLLAVSKKEIREFLEKEEKDCFEDPTNREERYLRARFRQSIFPWLNSKFGKSVQKNLALAAEDVHELNGYFEKKMEPLLKNIIEGPWGSLINLQSTLPSTLLEIKYLLRLFCEQKGFFLSREIIQEIAQALIEGKSSKGFAMGSQRILVDRKRLFMLNALNPFEECSFEQEIKEGSCRHGDWNLKVSKELFSHTVNSEWQSGWQGRFEVFLPMKNCYALTVKSDAAGDWTALKKRWSQEKIPRFLTKTFPFIICEKQVFHEFLTGCSLEKPEYGELCWKFELFHSVFTANLQSNSTQRDK